MKLSPAVYAVLDAAVLAIHLSFILWVILGWLVTRGRPVLRWGHLVSVAYAIFIEVSYLPCPLTLLEQRLEAGAGIVPYHGPFILHYLEMLVYPNIPAPLLVIGAVVVCLGIFWIYIRRHREASGW